jgi:hypothetical protein
MCRVEGPISEADVETVVDLILLEQSLGKKISSKSDLLHLDKYQVIRLGYLGNFLSRQTKSHLNTDRYVFNARNLWSLVPKQAEYYLSCVRLHRLHLHSPPNVLSSVKPNSDEVPISRNQLSC